MKEDGFYANGLSKGKSEKEQTHNQSIISLEEHNKLDQKVQKKIAASNALPNAQLSQESERNKHNNFAYLTSKTKNQSAVRSQYQI